MRIIIKAAESIDLPEVCSELSDLIGLEWHVIDDDKPQLPKYIVQQEWFILGVYLSNRFDPDLLREIRSNSLVIEVCETEVDRAELDALMIVARRRSSKETAIDIQSAIGAELAVRYGSPNTFGDIIRITSFGESHGPAIGAVMDGVRPGIEISMEEIQREMNRRRPGQSDVTTPRFESDRVHVLSGIFNGKTTGAPIAMVVYNKDQDPSKYEGIKHLFRPGHADFTYYRKYGIRDYRGGGRSSGRETAGRVACGAIARKILMERGVEIFAHSVMIGGVEARRFDRQEIERNKVRCADPDAAAAMEAAIHEARSESDSVGGIAQMEIHGVPAGLGDPVFLKLDARLTYAVMTLGAVKGIEVGEGFGLANLHGSESNDQMSEDGFLSNNAGGITGGISTGQPIILRAVVKPTSSIARPQRTVDLDGNEREIEVHGRHDPCILPRIIPVMESMAALVILDAWEIQSRLRPDWEYAL
jgi:chorismate synthase